MVNVPVKLASIDIGTNSTLLLVAEYDGTELYPIVNRAEITRLGQAVNKTRRLAPEAAERTFKVLSRYKELCNRHDVAHVSIGGTSALRDAANGQDFLDRVHDELGWDIQVLTGNLEAELTFLSTSNEFDEIHSDYLVADIGGGSTEFIHGDKKHIHFKKSVDFGTVRFTEKFIRHDPPTDQEIENLRQAVQESVHSNLEQLKISPDNTIFIGVAGTVTTLQAVEQEMTEYNESMIHRSQLSQAQVEALFEKFCSLPLKKRKKLPGLQPQRADVIIAGNIIVQEIMKHFAFSSMYISDRGVRYGLMYDYIRKNFGE
jgi:exopolyphosphatase/guanosine-5'-triphosphate,3'-diphosphate pyrophosphatase